MHTITARDIPTAGPSTHPGVPPRASEHATTTGSGSAAGADRAASGRRGHRALALGIAAVAMLIAFVGAPSRADAATSASTGAWVHTTGYCGGGTVTVSSSSTQLEWRQVFIYVNGRLAWAGDWERLSILQPTRSVYFANSQTAVWVRYADDLGGGRFAYTSEWTNFGGNYSCIAW